MLFRSVATNIGVHFFDMLSWIFGDVKTISVHHSASNKVGGFLELEKARVRWFLSLDYNDIPDDVKATGKRTFRSVTVDGEKIEISDGFTELHTETYKEILAGRGFGIEESRQSVETVYSIRNLNPSGLKGEYHPFLKKIS